MLILLYVLLFISYTYFIYKNGNNFISVFWLIAYSFAFLLPVYLGIDNQFGYLIPKQTYNTTNLYYLITMITFIVGNYMFLYRKKVISKEKKFLFDFKKIKKLATIYFIIMVILALFLGSSVIFTGTSNLMHIHPLLSMLIPATIFGSIFSASLMIVLSTNKREKNLSIFMLIFSIIFGLLFTFGRRLVIFPLISFVILYLIKKKKKPNVIWLVLGIISGILIIMPYMINLRTFGLIEGTSKFIDLYSTDNYRLKEYIAMSTDVSIEYSLANLLIASDIRTSSLTLLKPILIFIPRSIWPDKPIPLSEHLVKDLGLSNVDLMSIPPGIIGENYTYFGIFGVIICGFLWGVATAYFDRNIEVNQKKGKFIIDTKSIFIACFSIQFIISAIRGDMATGLQEASYIFIPLLILLHLAKYKIKS